MSTRQTAANELLTNMFRVRLGRGFYGECLVKLTFCSYLAEYFCSHSHEVFQSKVFYKIYVLACLIPHIIFRLFFCYPCIKFLIPFLLLETIE